MSNIKPTKPSYITGYWKPWEEGADMLLSYYNYSNDLKLQKYNADIVGQYISQASQEQVTAINQLTNEIGLGNEMLFNQTEEISNRISESNYLLEGLNIRQDLLIEQQRINNELLKDIIEHLKIPDKEKERLNSITLGIKFFAHAQRDEEVYEDALEEFLKAEQLKKQDYFVLHKIGLIYLYAVNHLNPKVALKYFLNAAKYANLELHSLLEVQVSNKSKPQGIDKLFKEAAEMIVSAQKASHGLLQRKLKLGYNRATRLMDQMETAGIVGPFEGKANRKVLIPDLSSLYEIIESMSLDNDYFQQDKIAPRADQISPVKKSKPRKEYPPMPSDEEIDAMFANRTEIDIYDPNNYQKQEKFNKEESDLRELIKQSYDNAAYAAYIIGDFEAALNNKIKAIEFYTSVEHIYQEDGNYKYSILRGRKVDPKPKDLIEIAKYHVRYEREELVKNPTFNNEKMKSFYLACVNSLLRWNSGRDNYVLDILSDIDLVDNVDVLKTISENNQHIDNDIDILVEDLKTERWKNFTKTDELASRVNSFKKLPFHLKEKERLKVLDELGNIQDKVYYFEEVIKSLLKKVDEYKFIKLTNEQIKELKSKLKLLLKENYKFDKLDKLNADYQKICDQLDKNIIKVGSNIEGGIVFHVDKTGKHGLVYCEKSLGKAIWGVQTNAGTSTKLGSGKKNTKLIVERASSSKYYHYINFYYLFKINYKSKTVPFRTASTICNLLDYNGYRDWYLPSHEELELLFKNLRYIDFDSDDGYWSSSEADDEWALISTKERYKSKLKSMHDVNHYPSDKKSKLFKLKYDPNEREIDKYKANVIAIRSF